MTKPFTGEHLMLYGGAARALRPQIEQRHPGLPIVSGNRRDLDKMPLEEICWLVGWKFPEGLFGTMPQLRWIQSVGVGVENWISDPTLAPNVTVTSTKGLYSDAVAEYVIWALLSLSRRFHLGVRNQLRRKWVQVTGTTLAGQTVGIVGVGQIGRAVARRLSAFDVRIIGIERYAVDPDEIEGVEEIVEFSRFDSVLGRLDALVLCLPLTDESRNMLDSRALKKLKQGAVIVNVAREGVMDYASLSREIERGHVSSAALDVFEKEPLRWWNPLWKNKNLLLTAHLAGLTRDYKSRVAGRICTNIDRIKSGEELLGIVDRSRGY